jgi:tetratricopeptide (TPR) repeat protein
LINPSNPVGGRHVRIVRLALAFFILFAIPASRQHVFAAAAQTLDSGSVQAALHQFNAGNYPAAIGTLQAAASQNSSDAAVYYWLGRSYYEIRDYDNAIAQGEKSISLDPKNSVYHDWMGREYGGKADRDRSFSDAKKVKKEFEDAVRLNPSNIDARRDLEEYLIDAPWIAGGNKDEGRDQVDAIAAIDPLEGHLARAKYDEDALKKPDQVESEYHEALDGKPKNLKTYFEAAEFYQRENKPAEIDQVVLAASQVSANDPRLSYFRGVSAVLSNTNLGPAEQNLKSYLASTPDRSDWPSHAAAREWLGRLYELQGKRPEAAEQYRASLQLDPSRKETRNRLEKMGK